jgi:hypothetical protein
LAVVIRIRIAGYCGYTIAKVALLFGANRGVNPGPERDKARLQGLTGRPSSLMLPVSIRMRIMRKLTLKRLGGIALLAVIAAIAVAPATALAQDALSNPSAAQYEPQSQVQGTSTNGSNNGATSGSNVGNGPVAAATPNTGLNSNVGSLPFTGLDVIVLAVVAAALLGTGLALRRLSSPKAPGA